MGTSLSAPTLKRWLHALWSVLPWERLHPHRGSCRRLSTVFTTTSCVASGCIHGMTPRRKNGEGRCPPRRAPLTEADVRRLIADAVGQPSRVAPTQVGPPNRGQTANTTGHAVRPLPTCPPHRGAPG